MVSLFLEYRANVSAKDSEGSIALHTAAAVGQANVVKVLIDAGSDVNAPGANEEKPLHVSSGSDHIEVVRLLVNNGADLSAVDTEGRTPASVLNCLVTRKWNSTLKKDFSPVTCLTSVET